MRAFEIIAGLLAGLSTIAYAQTVQPTCNSGGGIFMCSDATNACQAITTGPIGVGRGKIAEKIGGFGSADVWLRRKVSSATLGNMNDLCNQIVAGCCGADGTRNISASYIPLMQGENGQVEIVAA